MKKNAFAIFLLMSQSVQADELNCLYNNKEAVDSVLSNQNLSEHYKFTHYNSIPYSPIPKPEVYGTISLDVKATNFIDSNVLEKISEEKRKTFLKNIAENITKFDPHLPRPVFTIGGNNTLIPTPLSVRKVKDSYFFSFIFYVDKNTYLDVEHQVNNLGVSSIHTVKNAFHCNSGIPLATSHSHNKVHSLYNSIKESVKSQHLVAESNKKSGGLDNGYISNGVLFDQGYPVAIDFDTPFGQFNNGDGVPEVLENLGLDLNEWHFEENIHGRNNNETVRELYITPTPTPNSNIYSIKNNGCYIYYGSFVSIPKNPIIKLVTKGCY